MTIKDWINKPYPFIEDTKTKIIVSIAFGLFIYLFLLIYQPFGIEAIIANKAIYLLGFGFITLLVLFTFLLILPIIFPQFYDIDQWNIGKEIAFISSNFLAITLLNYLYDSFFSQVHSQQHNLFFFILVTIAVGVIPVAILVFFSEIYLREKRQKEATKMSSKIQIERKAKTDSPHKTISLKADTGKAPFLLDDHQLIFVKSEDNYCKIYFQEGENIKTALLRVTLKNIEQQLETFPDMLRCHRSYIVNKKKVIRISGNARAYNIHFENCMEIAAVSRNFPKEALL